MNAQQLDPVSLSIALAGTLFGPALAEVIGPYAVIILAATTGASWTLGGDASSLRSGAHYTAWYFLRINATALLVTAGAANVSARWLSGIEVTWLLAPIGLLIGAIGNHWPQIGRWAIRRVARAIERRAGES